jgi:uncharacterized membrane protein
MPRNNFTEEEIKNIEAAIAEAEKRTSGEIRIFVDNHCREDVLDRAAFVFDTLEMHKTKLRNGVLFYIAIKDRKFAILGDAGINEKVPPRFWDKVRDHMLDLFKQDKYGEAFVTGIRMAGEQLSAHFPFTDDENELSNEMMFGR